MSELCELAYAASNLDIERSRECLKSRLDVISRANLDTFKSGTFLQIERLIMNEKLIELETIGEWLIRTRPKWWLINPYLYIKRRDKAYAEALQIIHELSLKEKV